MHKPLSLNLIDIQLPSPCLIFEEHLHRSVAMFEIDPTVGISFEPTVKQRDDQLICWNCSGQACLHKKPNSGRDLDVLK